MTTKDAIIWAEMARRKKQFHPGQDWDKINLWGLFSWGQVSHLLKTGELTTTMKKENRTIWVNPSPEAYKQHIEPLLKYSIKTLSEMAGW